MTGMQDGRSDLARSEPPEYPMARPAAARWIFRPGWASYSARTDRRCRRPKMSTRSVTSVRAVSTNLSA
jgi:hypothetical protein